VNDVALMRIFQNGMGGVSFVVFVATKEERLLQKR